MQLIADFPLKTVIPREAGEILANAAPAVRARMCWLAVNPHLVRQIHVQNRGRGRWLKRYGGNRAWHEDGLTPRKNEVGVSAQSSFTGYDVENVKTVVAADLCAAV